MGRADYASAVSAVRAMESSLLTSADMEQILSARGKSEADMIVNSKKGENFSLSQVWDMLSGYAPDSEELKILLYKNDFHNLKAVLKSLAMGGSPEKYYISPTNLNLGELAGVISEKNYENLPSYMGDTPEKAYDIITGTMDGQLTDCLIDVACMKAMMDSAEKTGNDFIIKYAELTAVFADIKTAYRCCLMKKSENFLETAICGTRELPKEGLIRAVLAGMDSLMGFIENSPYGESAELLRKSVAVFEKWCDDEICEFAQSARLKAFGIEPLIAYYIAVETEIKNLRIISVCRECGTDRAIISERVRKLYA